MRVIITAWLVALAVIDRRARRVPNVLVLPVMCGALLWQGYVAFSGQANTVAFVLVCWIALFALWRAHIFGGGDAKLLMALLALFPTTQFLFLLSAVKLLVTVPVLLLKYARRDGRQALSGIRQRLASGHLLPEPGDLETQGRPHCWSYAMPGVIYLWWFL